MKNNLNFKKIINWKIIKNLKNNLNLKKNELKFLK